MRGLMVGVQCTTAPPAIRNATLHYFDARGRAEAIRLLLEFTQVSFEAGESAPLTRTKELMYICVGWVTD